MEEQRGETLDTWFLLRQNIRMRDENGRKIANYRSSLSFFLFLSRLHPFKCMLNSTKSLIKRGRERERRRKRQLLYSYSWQFNNFSWGIRVFHERFTFFFYYYYRQESSEIFQCTFDTLLYLLYKKINNNKIC